MKSGLVHDVDNRKLARGEKWLHYNKTTLIKLLAGFNNYTASECALIYRKCKTANVFSAILHIMEQKGMMLILPV